MSKEILLATALSMNPGSGIEINPGIIDTTPGINKEMKQIVDTTSDQVGNLYKVVNRQQNTLPSFTFGNPWQWNDWKNPLFLLNGGYFIDRDTGGGSFKQDVWESIRIVWGVNGYYDRHNISLNLDGIWYIWAPSNEHNMDRDGVRTDMVELTITMNQRLHECVLSLWGGVQFFWNLWLEAVQNWYHRLIQSREFEVEYDPDSSESLHLYGWAKCNTWSYAGVDTSIYAETTQAIWEWVSHTEAWVEGKKAINDTWSITWGIKWSHTDYPDHDTFNMFPYDEIDGTNIQGEVWLEYRINPSLDFILSTNEPIKWWKPWESFVWFKKRFK